MFFPQVVAASHLDRQVSSESITRECSTSFGSTGVEREHHEWVQHSILVRQVSSESITSECDVSFGSTCVEREHHQRVPRCIWIDRCRARASPVAAASHLNRQVSSENTTIGCNISFGSTGVEPNAMPHPLVMLSLDTCRTR